MKLTELNEKLKQAKKAKSTLDYKSNSDVLFVEGDFSFFVNDSNDLTNNKEIILLPESAKIIITPYAKGIYGDKFLNELSKRNIQLMKLDFYGNPVWEFHNKTRTNAFLMKAQLGLNEPKFNQIRAQLISDLIKQKVGMDILPSNVAEKTDMQKWIKTAMNLEGRAASSYWQAFRDKLGIEDYSEKRAVKGIKGANKDNRNASDAVNALLNLGYGIMAHDITFTLYEHGLEPTIGFYHSFDYHDSKNPRYSLTWDIIEPYRVKVDEIVRLYYSKIDTDSFEWESPNEKRHLLLKETPHVIGKPSQSEYKKWVNIFTSNLPNEYPFIINYKRTLKTVLEQSGVKGLEALNRIIGSLRTAKAPKIEKTDEQPKEQTHEDLEVLK